MNKQFIFTLGRVIDPKYLPNQLIISFTIVAFIAGISIHLFRGNNVLDSTVFGVVLAVVTFFSWALTREIYPLGEYAALVASLLCIVGLAWFGIFPVIILLLLWLLLNLRFINQTTGLEASMIDRVVLLIFTIICAFLFSWVFLGFEAIVFAVNYWFSKEKSDSIFMIISMGAAFVFMVFYHIWYTRGSLTYLNGVVVGVLLLVFTGMMWLGRTIEVVGDHSQKIVPANRVVSAQFLSIVFLGVYVVWFGDESIVMLIPLWCILLCVILFSPIQLVKNVERFS